MKINKQKLKEINNLYSQFKKYDKEIDIANAKKELYMKKIIKELKQTDFLKSIKEIEGIVLAQLGIWNDVENPNWIEYECIVHTKKKSNEFDDYEDYMHYENDIRSRFYLFLDDYLDLNNFIVLYVER